MHINPLQAALEIEQFIEDRQKQALITAETIVPGAGREGIYPLISDATLVILNAQLQNGQALIDGLVICQALYRRAEETALSALTATGKLSQIIDIDQAKPGQILRALGQIDHVEANYENGHMIFRVAVTLDAHVSELAPLNVIKDIEDMAGIEKHFTQLTINKLAAEAQSQALLQQRVTLPPELDARIALMDAAEARILSVQPDLGGVRIKGEVLTETLIGTGTSGRPIARITVALPFDELIELPEWLSAHVLCDANIMRLQTQVIEGMADQAGTLSIECELQLTTRAMAEEQLNVLEDAFSTGAEGIHVEQACHQLKSGVAQFEGVESFHGSVMLPPDAMGTVTILCVRARPILGDYQSTQAQTTLNGILEVQVLYQHQQEALARVLKEDLPFSIQMPVALPEGALICLSALGAESGAVMGDRLEIKSRIKICAEYRQVQTLVIAESIENMGPQPRREGILLTWPKPKDSAWSIAKKYRIPNATVALAMQDQKPLVLRL